MPGNKKPPHSCLCNCQENGKKVGMKSASVCVCHGFLGVVRTTVRPSGAVGGVGG